MSDAFEQAKRLFLDGCADFDAGRLDAAQARFEASLALLPGRVSTLVNLAATHIRLGRPQAALALTDDAIAAQPDDVDAWLQRGSALAALGHDDEALACLERVLALDPAHPAAWRGRARTLGALRRHGDALAAHERLLALAPDDADAWFGHGQCLQYLDRHDEALGSYERALALDPGLAQAWTNRANILKDAGRVDEALAAFRRAIESGGDAALNGYYIAALTGRDAPSAPPQHYVEQLFDDYADTFDGHLVGALGYRAHRELIAGLAGVGPARFVSALDLGCGTGLCGPLAKAIAGRVDGVDLSASMLAKARALGVYDRLDRRDLVGHLAQTDRRHDLVLAADVFIYVGALDAVFDGVRRVLEPGGVFCFSVEHAGDDVDFELRRSLRYAHSRRYLLALAGAAGFNPVRIDAQPIRDDQRAPVAGLYVYLRRRTDRA